MIGKQITAVPHFEFTNTQGLIMLHWKLDWQAIPQTFFHYRLLVADCVSGNIAYVKVASDQGPHRGGRMGVVQNSVYVKCKCIFWCSGLSDQLQELEELEVAGFLRRGAGK